MNEIALGAVAQVIDCEHKTAPVAEPGRAFAFSVGTPALRGAGIDFSQAKPVDEETYFAWSRRAELTAGDLILAREAPVGGVGLIDGRHRVCLGQRTVLVRPNSADIDARYLFYLLRSPGPQDWMKMHSEGSTVKHLNVSDVRRIALGTVPPLDEQRRIAGVLGALDDLIEVNRGIAHQCDELAEALWHEAASGASSEVRVADFATVVLGGTPSRKEPSFWGGDVAWLNSGEANEFRVLSPSEFITTLGLSKSSTKMMPKGATIIAITGATLGQVSRIEIPACGNQSLVGVWSEESALNDFIYFGVRNRVDLLIRSATGGAQQHVNKANVEELTLPWIAQSEIDAWHQVASPLLEATAELLVEAQTLANTRDELLPLLISGRVRVREDGVAA